MSRIVLETRRPSHSLSMLFAYPTSCETTCACITNTTILSIAVGDTRTVAYRYLQNKKGYKTSRYEVAGYTFCTLALMTITFYYIANVFSTLKNHITPIDDENPEIVLDLSGPFISILLLAATTISFAPALPSICNTLRYGETKNVSGMWLARNLGKSTFRRIDSLDYTSKENMETLDTLLETRQISSSNSIFMPKRYSAK